MPKTTSQNIMSWIMILRFPNFFFSKVKNGTMPTFNFFSRITYTLVTKRKCEGVKRERELNIVLYCYDYDNIDGGLVLLPESRSLQVFTKDTVSKTPENSAFFSWNHFHEIFREIDFRKIHINSLLLHFFF